MIRVAICDDSEYMRAKTKKCILKYSVQKNIDFSMKEYSTGEDLLADEVEFDIIFMDYQFENNGVDGITISKKIRERNKDVAIIFLSSFPGVVFQSFEVGTFRFLTKPIEEDKFFRAVDDYIKTLEKDNMLSIRLDGDNYFIKESRIMYVEGFGKYCIIHLDGVAEEEIECHETLSAIENRLLSNSFFRCHKSYLVNMKYIESYNHTDIELEGNQSVQVSRNKYKGFCTAFTNYLSNHNLGR